MHDRQKTTHVRCWRRGSTRQQHGKKKSNAVLWQAVIVLRPLRGNGGKPIAEITAPLLLMAVKKIEARGALEIAKRAFQTCGQIMRYAIAHGLAERNPAAEIRLSDALKPCKKKHYVRLSAQELPELLHNIDAYSQAA